MGTMMEISKEAVKTAELQSVFHDKKRAEEVYWGVYNEYKSSVKDKVLGMADLMEDFANHICNDPESKLEEIRCLDKRTPFGIQTLVTVYLKSGEVEQFTLGITHKDNMQKLISIVY